MKQHHIEIDKWLEDLRRCKSANLRKEEMEFIKELEQSTDKDQLIDDYLQDFITNEGITVDSQEVGRFDVENEQNEYLAGICPNGFKGQVELRAFLNRYMVYYHLYDVGTSDFGPYANLVDAKEKYRQLVDEHNG